MGPTHNTNLLQAPNNAQEDESSEARRCHHLLGFMPGFAESRRSVNLANSLRVYVGFIRLHLIGPEADSIADDLW